jgi:hypothetical protein
MAATTPSVEVPSVEVPSTRLLETANLLMAILVLIIILLVYLQWSTAGERYENMFYGYWMADDDFLHTAGLDAMLLYVGDATTEVSGKRPAYLIVGSGGVILLQHLIYMDLSSIYWPFGGVITRALTLSDDADGNTETGAIDANLDTPELLSIGKAITGGVMECSMDLNEGCMTWEAGGQLFARFYRDYAQDAGRHAHLVDPDTAISVDTVDHEDSE